MIGNSRYENELRKAPIFLKGGINELRILIIDQIAQEPVVLRICLLQTTEAFSNPNSNFLGIHFQILMFPKNDH